jgi:hypothetical protein
MRFDQQTQSRYGCPVCGANGEIFFETRNVPVYCNILQPTRAAAVAAEQAKIRLAFCHICGHIYNTAFDPARISYDAHYDNSLHFSPRFQNYARELAAHLIERYALKGKTIIDIGCGNASPRAGRSRAAVHNANFAFLR